MSDLDIKAAIEKLKSQMVTSWIKVGCKCGPSSYNAVNNEGWCKAEVERLRSKGVKSCSIFYKGHVAVFLLVKGETKDDILGMIESVGIEVE